MYYRIFISEDIFIEFILMEFDLILVEDMFLEMELLEIGDDE